MEPSAILPKQYERKQTATPPQRPNSPVPTKVNHLNVQAVSGARDRNCDMRNYFLLCSMYGMEVVKLVSIGVRRCSDEGFFVKAIFVMSINKCI